MAFVTISDPRNSDVVLEEEENYFSRSGSTAILNNTAGGTIKQGTVVWRAKGTDPAAVWDIVDASGDLSVNNEYAILLGAQVKGSVFRPAESFVVTAATDTKVILLRRICRVKEQVLKDVHVTGYGLTQGNFDTLKHLLAREMILVEDSLTAVA